ncbi:MAG: RNA polymerase factor sigma-54 [Treponema sp.]|nr:RNA polymerase factor sigma-54 [Treponema sp.]
MPEFSYGQVQQAAQVQRQILSQKQIQSLALLAMSNQDLHAEIRKVVAENPVLEVVNESVRTATTSRVSQPYDGTRTSYATAAGNEASQKFQEAYENAADTRETLQEHLLFQLNMMKLLPDEKALGEALIRNLDEKGWHTLAPVSLLDKSRPLQNLAMLNKMMDAIRRMDPEGTCCNNMEESLYVQARIAGDAPPLALFILDGHIDVLYSTDSAPDIERIRKKINNLLEAQKKLVFPKQTEQTAAQTFDASGIAADDVKTAIAFIARLNPHPAQGYSKTTTQYVKADIILERIENEMPQKAEENEILMPYSESAYYRIALAPGTLPDIRIIADIESEKYKGLKKNITAARQFLDMLAYRKSFILQSCEIIVKTQFNFFSSDGHEYLEPLTQNALAKMLGVNESTVSRMVNEKFLQTPWGQLFPLKYFFTNSQDKIKHAMQKIINTYTDAKPLSDSKLAEMLEAQGIRVARRTVAKYRAQLAIGSSYERKK